MAKPASHLEWTDGAASKVVEPSAAKKLLGWVALERPPFEFMNWLFFTTDEWLKYFEVTTDGLISLQSTYDVVIGVSGTHATINAAIADGSLGDNQRVLVFDPFTVTTTQTISKDGWVFDFKPAAIYAQGAATTPGLLITAERVKIFEGRFTDFDGGGPDVAVEFSAASKNCIIDNCSFFNDDTDIDDLGTNNTLGANNVNEV